ncbi:Aspartic proteinase CDR1, partial [Mucuna pruriens]
MANLVWFHLCLFVVYTLLCQTPILGASKGGFSVELIRHNSPNSPFYKSYAQNGPSTGVTSNNGDYLMKLSLGTPPVDVYGLIDTGSDLVWAQCTPCPGCYKQKNPMYEPLRSKTYTPIPCDSDQCNSLVDHSCSPQKLCSYSYGYADSSITQGIISSETVTFSSSNGEPVVVGNITFGCGHNNTGNFNENDMGMIGLGGGPLSLVSQMGNLYGTKKFSQCLVPFHALSSGTISFGDASDVSGEGVTTTPLVSQEGETPYFVTLQGISVGNTFVPFNSSSKMVSKGNIMIDSGTPTTYLPPQLYDNLMKELKVQINLPPIHDDPDLGTQLCYKSNTNLEGPILTAHFEGADVKLMPIQTFIPPKDGVFCFAMAGTTDGFREAVESGYRWLHNTTLVSYHCTT